MLMKADELVDQVKALPARERQKVLMSLFALQDEPARPSAPKRVRWPDVAARAKRIFGDRVLPNLVLAERDEMGR